MAELSSRRLRDLPARPPAARPQTDMPALDPEKRALIDGMTRQMRKEAAYVRDRLDLWATHPSRVEPGLRLYKALNAILRDLSEPAPDFAWLAYNIWQVVLLEWKFERSLRADDAKKGARKKHERDRANREPRLTELREFLDTHPSTKDPEVKRLFADKFRLTTRRVADLIKTARTIGSLPSKFPS